MTTNERNVCEQEAVVYLQTETHSVFAKLSGVKERHWHWASAVMWTQQAAPNKQQQDEK